MYSIGIPAYKASYLHECITSVLEQTFVDFELIVVNDNSPEDIESVVKTFNDSRIRYFKNDVNTGALHVVDNWNKCLSFATGEYFILMGDDDKMAPEFLDEFFNIQNKYPNLDVYHCRSSIIDEKSNVIGFTENRPEYESCYDAIVERLKRKRKQYISDFVYNTNTLKNNRGFYKLPLAWASDDISSYIAMGEKGIANINKPIFNYRRNSQTITSTGNAFYKMDAKLIEEKWLIDYIEAFKEKDKSKSTTLRKQLKRYILAEKIFIIYVSIKSNSIQELKQWYKYRFKYNLSHSVFIRIIFKYMLIRCFQVLKK